MPKKKSLAIQEKNAEEAAIQTLDAQIDRALSSRGGSQSARQLLLNTLLTSNQEFLLLVDELLQSKFGISDAQISDLHQDIGEALAVSSQVHRNGHRTLDLKSQKAIVEIAACNSVHEQHVLFEREFGVALPSHLQSEKILKG